MEQKLSFQTEIIRLSPFFLFFVLLTWFVSDNIFFWDTIQLGAKHAYYYYDNHFSKLLLPDDIDSGHIPVFGAYLALMWILFGKTLMVSHFAMLPFLIGIVWQSYRLVKRYISRKYIYYALTLFLADATLLSQSVLMSPDIPLLFLFLLGLNSVLCKKETLVTIASAGLVLISMRGMMVAFALLVLDIILNIRFTNVQDVIIQLTKKALYYLPAFLIFVCYSVYHFEVKGWIGYHKESPWASMFQMVDLKGGIYNCGILAWRLIDFGRIFLWLVSIIIVIKYFGNIIKDKRIQEIGLIFFVVMISLSISFIMYKNLSGHRYILPVYLLFSIFTSYLIFEKIKGEKVKYLVFGVLFIGLLSGNLWIYPDKISMGWDSTLAHLSYYKVRKEMQNYLQEKRLEINEVSSDFPDNSEQRYMDLSNSREKHNEINLSKDKFVIYSNVFNDVKDSKVDSLNTEYSIEKEYKQLGVYMRLYKRKSLN